MRLSSDQNRRRVLQKVHGYVICRRKVWEIGEGAYEESGEEDAEGGPDESYAENVGFVCHTCEALIRPEEA